MVGAASRRVMRPSAGSPPAAAAASRPAVSPVSRLRLTPGPQADRKPVEGRRRRRPLVETAGFELALDDAEVPREFGVISSLLVEEPLGILATDEHLDRVSEGVVEAAALVANDIDDHRGGEVTAASFVASYKWSGTSSPCDLNPDGSSMCFV